MGIVKIIVMYSTDNNNDKILWFQVSSASVIDWIKNPIPVNQMRSSDWSKCHSREYQHCDERMCPLMFKEETRYLKVCTECPKQYPWKDNPLGE